MNHTHTKGGRVGDVRGGAGTHKINTLRVCLRATDGRRRHHVVSRRRRHHVRNAAAAARAAWRLARLTRLRAVRVNLKTAAADRRTRATTSEPRHSGVYARCCAHSRRRRANAEKYKHAAGFLPFNLYARPRLFTTGAHVNNDVGGGAGYLNVARNDGAVFAGLSVTLATDLQKTFESSSSKIYMYVCVIAI